MSRWLPVIFLTLVSISLFPAWARQADAACKNFPKGSELSWQPAQKPAPAARVRFYNLGYYIETAYDSGNYLDAEKLANEYLELAKTYTCNWNYGNAIHEANRYLGLISLKRGEVDEAVEFLLRSGQSNGSPTLSSFGPNLDLANELLKRGKPKEVVAYLREAQSFWEMDDGILERWIDGINKGETPVLDRHASNEVGV